MTKSLDALIEQTVTDQVLPHVYAAVMCNGKLTYEGVAGDTGADRIYRIASMTKPITSVACMQLIEQGRIALDAPVTDYMIIAGPEVLEDIAADGTATLRPASRAATIRELLTHTGGYAYGLWNEKLAKLFAANGLGHMGPAGIERLNVPMVADPGTQWQYSIATDFVGRVVEEVAGENLDSYVRQHIAEPLGMPDTAFTLAAGADSRLTAVYRRRTSGELIDLEAPRPDPGEIYGGGGGLLSTPADYLRFLAALLNEGELDGARILSAESTRLMASNHTGNIPIGRLESLHAPSSAAIDLFPGIDKHWGLGFLINADPVPGRRRAGSQTWAGLYNTHFWIDRRANIAGLLMTQLLPFAEAPFMAFYDAFETAAYAEFT